jgi:hypothetical protein
MPFHDTWNFNLLRLTAVLSASAYIYPVQVHAQFDELPQRGGNALLSAFQGSLRGQVAISNGQKRPNVHIELRNSMGMVVSSRAVDSSGSFEIGNLQPGSYEVIATWGTEQSAAHVEILSLDTPITIRIESGSPPARRQAAVSVNALKVPAGAKKAFDAANRFLQNNDITNAWKQVNKALQACPTYAPALTLRGVLKTDGNQLQEAVTDFDAALQADRSYGLAYVGLASDYNLMGHFDDALRILDQASSQTAPSWQTHLETSKALLGKGIFDHALLHANQAANMLGRDFALLNLIKAYAYLGLKDKISAATELRHYLEQDSSSERAGKARTLLAEIAK